MNESFREHRPLLCDDLSDEEFGAHYCTGQHQRRLRATSYKGRARNKARGAIAIFTQWPDHWTNSLTYWCAGIGMILITIFIIYNTAVSLALLSQPRLSPIKSLTENNKIKNTNKELLSPLRNIFMHVFLKNNEEIDLSKYIAYIEIIKDKYRFYNYHLAIVFDDISDDRNMIDAEQNNKEALDLLWGLNHVDTDETLDNNGIKIKYTTLSQCLNNSPIKMFWRSLPKQFIEFLVRAVSIWEKGGIVFNPIILTPSSPRDKYINKLENLLRRNNSDKFPKEITKNFTKDDFKTLSKTKKQSKTFKKKVNNIRDIIYALENEDVTDGAQHILTEAEDTYNSVSIMSSPTGISEKIEGISENKSTPVSNLSFEDNNIKFGDSLITNNNKPQGFKIHNNLSSQIPVVDNRRLTLLPIMMKLFYNNEIKKNITNTDATDSFILNRKRKSPLPTEGPKNNFNLRTDNISEITKNNEFKYKPMIISTNNIPSENLKRIIEMESEPNFKSKLTIDLKGNILATDAPCHAFIGSIFSNALHHSNQETLTDFIIAELSIFCKGLLSSCKGIDVILL